MTKDEFFQKMQYEGSFEDMFHYVGHTQIVDDPDMHSAWMYFCNALQDLNDIEEDWVDPNPELEEES